MAKRYELSDEAWDVVSNLFIENHGRGRPRLSDRLMLDGVLWVLCSGAAWRDMPERFGPWSTVYQQFRGWRNQGTFDQMLKRLQLRLNEKGMIEPARPPSVRYASTIPFRNFLLTPQKPLSIVLPPSFPATSAVNRPGVNSRSGHTSCRHLYGRYLLARLISDIKC